MMTEIHIEKEISDSLEVTEEISSKVVRYVSNDVMNTVSVIQVIFCERIGRSTNDRSTADRLTTNCSMTDCLTTDHLTTDRSMTDRSTTDLSMTDRLIFGK